MDATGAARTPDSANQSGSGAHARTERCRWDAGLLRQCAWEIGERKAADAFVPPGNHVGLAMVTPRQGFAHWRIRHEWIERTAEQRRDRWDRCRMVLRVYDVTCIEFNGLNAHRIQDHVLPGICGHLYFGLPHANTWQLAEVGFLLRDGEFIPAARSVPVSFPPGVASSRHDETALLVDEDFHVEEIGNLWDQERILRERRSPRLRRPLRIAALAFGSPECNGEGRPPAFISELAARLGASGHEVHLLVPSSNGKSVPWQAGGVWHESLGVALDGTPLQVARRFARAAVQQIAKGPPFDLLHLHEWMTGLAPLAGAVPTVLSLSSIETTRRNGSVPSRLSLDIQKTERKVARTAHCILTPDWLRGKVLAEFGIDDGRVHAFVMEGRVPNEWEAPLDFGRVKGEAGFGPLDRLLLFVGPLELGAGLDLLVEAMPVLLGRWGNLRVAIAGSGELHGQLQSRVYQLGLGYAVHFLGDVERPLVIRLMRAAEALILPSRYRVPWDDAVVDLARRAGRAVVTTHAGPAHLVRHEETGIVTYDNPGSMVWAVDRILGDPAHAERMGRNGQYGDGYGVNWDEVARRYLELCAATFPELTERHGRDVRCEGAYRDPGPP